MRNVCLLIAAVLALSGCQTAEYRGNNFQYAVFQSACIAHIGNGAAMTDAVAKALPFYTTDIVPNWREEVLRGSTKIKARWYWIPDRGDFQHAQDGSYCRIGQFKDDPQQVLETLVGKGNFRVLDNHVASKDSRRAILQLTDRDGVIVLSQSRYSSFLYVMTPDLYIRQKRYNDPDLPSSSGT